MAKMDNFSAMFWDYFQHSNTVYNTAANTATNKETNIQKVSFKLPFKASTIIV